MEFALYKKFLASPVRALVQIFHTGIFNASVLILILCFSSLIASGQAIVSYSPGLTTTISPVAGQTNTNVVASPLTKSSGATGYCNSFYTGCNYYQITANSVAGQVYCHTVVPNPATSPDFFSFTITPNSPYIMVVTGFSITCGSYGSGGSSGAKQVMLAYQDGANPWVSNTFPVSVGTTGGCAPMVGINWAFVLTTTNTVVFKVIPYNSTVCNCSTNEFAFKNVVVLGNMTQLPIELVSFTATRTSHETINLEWVTETEKNNDYFEVEYSADAENFFPYARVKGAGNSLSRLSYSLQVNKDFGDNIPYFRLKQVDFDGEFKYSWIITLPEARNDDINLSVNYSFEKKGAIVSFYLNDPGLANVSLYDVSGQNLFSTGVLEYNKGLNEVFIEQKNAGLYLVEYSDGYSVKRRKKIIFRKPKESCFKIIQP